MSAVCSIWLLVSRTRTVTGVVYRDPLAKKREKLTKTFSPRLKRLKEVAVLLSRLEVLEPTRSKEETLKSSAVSTKLPCLLAFRWYGSPERFARELLVPPKKKEKFTKPELSVLTLVITIWVLFVELKVWIDKSLILFMV